VSSAAVCPVSRSAPNSLPPALPRESTCVHGVAWIVRTRFSAWPGLSAGASPAPCRFRIQLQPSAAH
jgi:hypothetical protein